MTHTKNPPLVFRTQILLTVEQATRLLKNPKIKRVVITPYSRLNSTMTGWPIRIPKSIFLRNLKLHSPHELLVVSVLQLKSGDLLLDVVDYDVPDRRDQFDLDWSGRAEQIFSAEEDED